MTNKSCEYCNGSRVNGVHIPTDFDDREESRDGKVFVARCDECWSNRFDGCVDNDMAAAQKIAALTGWEIHKSYDRDDAVDPQERAAAAGRDYCRPYFKVTLAEAEAVHGFVADWKYEVQNGDTRLGYEEWLRHKRESETI